MARLIEARVIQKAGTIEELNNSYLKYYDGEQVFVKSDVDDNVISYKVGANGKKFNELPYPDFYAKGKVTPSSVFTGLPSGVYIPTLNGLYNGTVTVNLGEGYQVLHWDGSTLQKVVYPFDYNGIVFGGVIDDSTDLSNPTEPIWYIASAGEYNTVPPITLSTTSILTWDGVQWSHIPFDLEVRGEFLVADTMDEMRSITPQVAQLLVNGTYKGVTLLGYYEKGDTPAPIEYYLSDTTGSDDGGSVIEVGGIKLVHDFKEDIELTYFGVKENDVLNDFLDKVLLITSSTDSYAIIPKGDYLLKSNYVPILNSKIKGKGRDSTKITLDPSTIIIEGDGFENYMFVNLNGSIEISDLELDCNLANIQSERSSGIDNRNANNIAIYKRLRIKNAKAVLPQFSGGYGITFWHGGCDNVLIEDIEFENIGQSDLGLFETFNCSVRNIKSKNCGYMVINIESANNSRGVSNCIVDTVFAQNVGRSIISIIRNSASVGEVESVSVKNVYVDKCAMTNTDVGAIRIRGTKNCTIDTVTVGETNSVGIRVSGDWYGQKGTVINYSDLPSTGISNGDIWRVSSEGKMYTYKSGSFQEQGQGQPQNLLQCKNLVIRNVNINKISAEANGEGIRIQGEIFCNHDNITLTDIYIANSYGAGGLFTYSDRITLNSIKIDKVDNSRGLQFNICNDIAIKGGQISEINTYGVGFTNCKDVTVDGLKILNANVSAFYVDGNTDIVKIVNSTTIDNRISKLLANSVTILSTLSDMKPRVIITGNDFKDATGVKVTIQNEIIRDDILIFNNIGISNYASNTVKGLVNQGVAVPNGSSVDTLLGSLRGAGLIAT